jgi:hypothetical protein
MTVSSEKKSNKKMVNIGISPSLSQGSKFDKYQKQIKKNLEKKIQLSFSEGFDNMNGVDLQANGLTKQSINAIKQNSISNQQLQTLNELRQQYQTTLSEYQNLLNQISGTTSSYFSRVDPSNPYLGKTIQFSTGQIFYVTSQGVAKYIPSTIILKSVDIPQTPIQINVPFNNSFLTPGTTIPTTPPLVAGTTVQMGQSLGNEGSNVYVDEFLPSDVSPSYMGCYATNSSNNNMTFIGGSPPPPSGSLQNINFSQPQLSSNSYTYYDGAGIVPNWVFNACLINNSTAWGYPMPYPSGEQAASIQGLSFAYQWIVLDAGTYTFTFYACGRPGYSGANTVNVFIGNDPTNIQGLPVAYTFTAPTTGWQSYSTPINITTSGNYVIGFYGTIDNPNNSTAIQNVQLTSTGSTSGGSYTYSQCEQAAISGGYQYFALQNVNPNTSTGYCAVSNSEPAVTQFGQSMIPSKLNPVWSSNTSGQTGNSAILSVSGSLQVISSSGQSVYSTPNSNAQPSNYLGCYGDGQNRAMPLYNNGSQQYNLSQCQQIAQQQGATYFGLQNSSSGTTAQCALSNDFGQTIGYGKAGNCTQISDGSYSGGGWSNAVYNTSNPQSNYVLILNDSSIVIQRGTNPNDNQGEIWSFSFTAGSVNPLYVAANGIYGQNWISSGETLASGDWIGSPNGYAQLIMQGDGNLVIYTFQMQINCQKMNDGNQGGGIGANATYNMGVKAIPGNIGSLAYIDQNSELHSYPASNQTYGNTYSTINNTDTPGNDIPGAAFQGTNQQCATACNENDQCAGYVTNGNGTYCWPKTSSMYPYSGQPVINSDRNIYVRTKTPSLPPLGVSQNTNNTDTVTYQNYITGGSLDSEYGLSKATSVQQQQLSQLQSQLDLLANQINNLNNKYQTGSNNLEQQSRKNVSGLNGYITNLKQTNNDISIVSKMNDGNLQNILSDSDIVVLQKNYSYLVWSILAAGAVLITMNITKK